MRYRVDLVGRGILGSWRYLSNARSDLARKRAEYRRVNPNMLVLIWDRDRGCWLDE